MSLITNCILSFLEEDPASYIEQANQFFAEQAHKPGFIHVEDPRLPEGWFVTDGKTLEVELAIGVFNYLDLDGLLQHLRTLPWDSPECAELLVLKQEADRWESYPLGGGIMTKKCTLQELGERMRKEHPESIIEILEANSMKVPPKGHEEGQ